MLSRSSKDNQVQQLKKSFTKSKASFLVNCIGLNVEEMTNFRKALKENQGNIQVIRNTLSLRAMEGESALKKVYAPFMKGPNAFVVAYKDPVKVAKLINKMAEESDFFEIKAGVLDCQVLSRQDVKTLARLPSEEVLKAQFLGLLSEPLTRFLLTIKEAPQSFVRLLSVRKTSLEEKKD